MRKHTMIVRGVLPVAVAVASLLTPFATAVASEPSLTGDDATATDTSLTEPIDDTTSTTETTTDSTDGTLDGSTDTDGTVVDDDDELTGTVDDLLAEGEELTDATTTEVERVVTADEGGDGSTDDDPATDDDASTEDEGTSTDPEEDSAGQPAPADDQADRGSDAEPRRSPAAATGPRSPVPPPAAPPAWNGERSDMYEELLLGGFGGEPGLAPRTRVDRAQDTAPPELRVGMADLDYLPSAGQRSTAPIMDILLHTRALPSTAARIMAPFPVVGLASYSDDWGAPRHPDRVHRGVDIFAERGTPIVASMDGVISGLRHHQGLGGNWLRLEAPDGTYLYYAHLDVFAAGIEQGVLVVRGQVLGTVGTSGNAQFTPPHLHLQIHPGGGAPVPPLPYLDLWLDQAHQAAQSFEASNGGVPAPQVAPPVTAETTPDSVAGGSEAPAPAGSPVVGADQAYALDPASASSGGPAALGLGVLAVIAWAMLRRPRKRSDEEADGFLDLGVAPTPSELPIRLDAPRIPDVPQTLDVPRTLDLPPMTERSDRELVGARTP